MTLESGPTTASDDLVVRVVATGHDESGRAVVASDESVTGSMVARLWGSDHAAVYPDHGNRPRHSPGFPPVGGYRLAYSRFEPGQVEAHDRYVSAILPGDPQPGMHRTDSTDLVIVLEGEIALELDDNAVVRLRRGDVVVQNGTRHRWFNDGSDVAVIAAVTIGARRREPNEVPRRPGQ